MTPRQADKLIKKGKPVVVHSKHFNETFTATFVSRDRWNLRSSEGGVYDRQDLELVSG